MKRIVAAALLALALCGCSGNGNAIVRDNNDERLDVDERFIANGRYYRFGTVVDSLTGVTYLVWDSNAGKCSVGGITVLLNSDGTPVISEEV